MSPDRDCVLECGPDKTCYVDTCCARTSQNQTNSEVSPHDSGLSLRQRAKCSTPEQTVPPATDHVPATFTDNVTAVPSWSAAAIETSDSRA